MQAAVTHNTFVVERTYARAPERVFAALSDPAKKRRWYAEGEEHEVDEFTTDFRTGGAERVRYRLGQGSPFPGAVLESDGVFLDIETNRRVVIASAMNFAGKRISAALITFELLPAANGTRLILTHQAAFFEGADGPAMREQGWRVLLDRLAAESN